MDCNFYAKMLHSKGASWTLHLSNILAGLKLKLRDWNLAKNTFHWTFRVSTLMLRSFQNVSRNETRPVANSSLMRLLYFFYPYPPAFNCHPPPVAAAQKHWFKTQSKFKASFSSLEGPGSGASYFHSLIKNCLLVQSLSHSRCFFLFFQVRKCKFLI